MATGNQRQGTLRASLAADILVLAPAQARLARFLLDHFGSASDYTITELANAVGVSVGTVSQLVRRFDLRGYQDLRLTLAREAVLAGPESALWMVGDLDAAPGSVEAAIQRVVAANSTAIVDTARRLDRSALEMAVDRLSGARRVDCVGAGTALLMASEMALKLRKLGIIAMAHSDSHAQLMSAATLGPEDVLLAVSHSGRTLETIRSAEVAHSQGCHVVAITGLGRSPLGRVADVQIETVSYDQGFQVEPMASAVAELSIIQILFVMLLERGGGRAQEHLTRTQEVTEDRHIKGAAKARPNRA